MHYAIPIKKLLKMRMFSMCVIYMCMFHIYRLIYIYICLKNTGLNSTDEIYE